MAFPNVFGIGVEKCGTTLLNRVLSQHPDVLTPKKKELFFFNANYERGLDWYLSWYRVDRDYRHICDITPSYFRNPRTLRRIRQHAPDARVVVVMRHPVERSMSHYVHRIRHIAMDLEAYGASFWEEFEQGKVKGLLFPLYFQKLRILRELFPPENLLLLVYENDIRNLESGTRKLFEFLGVPPLPPEEPGRSRVNRGYMPHFVYGGETGLDIEDGEQRRRVPKRTLLFCHAKGTREWKRVDDDLARRNVEAADGWTRHLSAADAERLFQDYYRDDCERLAETFDLDIAPWSVFRDIDYDPAPIDARYSSS